MKPKAIKIKRIRRRMRSRMLKYIDAILMTPILNGSPSLPTSRQRRTGSPTMGREEFFADAPLWLPAPLVGEGASYLPKWVRGMTNQVKHLIANVEKAVHPF